MRCTSADSDVSGSRLMQRREEGLQEEVIRIAVGADISSVQFGLRFKSC